MVTKITIVNEFWLLFYFLETKEIYAVNARFTLTSESSQLAFSLLLCK